MSEENETKRYWVQLKSGIRFDPCADSWTLIADELCFYQEDEECARVRYDDVLCFGILEPARPAKLTEDDLPNAFFSEFQSVHGKINAVKDEIKESLKTVLWVSFGISVTVCALYGIVQPLITELIRLAI